MADLKPSRIRRTAVDEIFAYLQDEICSLRLMPGDKISEAEIATQFGVSRQPVRDAFSRLANRDLLLIRPQRATEVKRFSIREIEKSRFVRAAIEAEVLRRSALSDDPTAEKRLQDSLDKQAIVVANEDLDGFGILDYEFHKIICSIAEADYAFEIIQDEKAKVDRLCALGLSKESRMHELLEDHIKIAKNIVEGRPDEAVAACRIHLSRLDETIAAIEATNAHYFE